jgi:hypothetical protein
LLNIEKNEDEHENVGLNVKVPALMDFYPTLVGEEPGRQMNITQFAVYLSFRNPELGFGF